jgi:hypothetical protein
MSGKRLASHLRVTLRVTCRSLPDLSGHSSPLTSQSGVVLAPLKCQHIARASNLRIVFRRGWRGLARQRSCPWRERASKFPTSTHNVPCAATSPGRNANTKITCVYRALYFLPTCDYNNGPPVMASSVPGILRLTCD